MAVPTWNMRYPYPNAAWINPSRPASIAAYASAGAIERERVGRQAVEREIVEQADDGVAPALGRPTVAQPRRDRRHLRAADRQPAAVEVAAERQRHVLARRTRRRRAPPPRAPAVRVRFAARRGCRTPRSRAVPRRACPSDSSTSGSASGATASMPRSTAASRRHGCDVDREHPGAGALEQQCGQRADRTEAEHDDRLAEQRSGIEADLQRGLDEREHRRSTRVDATRARRRRRRRRRTRPDADGTRRRALPSSRSDRLCSTIPTQL